VAKSENLPSATQLNLDRSRKNHCTRSNGIGPRGTRKALASTHLWHCQRAWQAAGRGCLLLGWAMAPWGCWVGCASRFYAWEAAAAACSHTELSFAAVLLLLLWMYAECCLLSLLLPALQVEAP
jgi:hypothetical protein